MEWIETHRQRWAAKPALRRYYETEIFDRILGHRPAGPCLEVGAGPGFFSAYAGDVITADIAYDRRLSVVSDIHRLPFADATFASVVAVDVLHHLAAPQTALNEIARVLRRAGRLILVEPWAGAAGSLFYRHLHHEECAPVPDPFGQAFASGKDAMEGNAWIPKAVLADRPAEFATRIPGLSLVHTEWFGGPAYVMTGGFQTAGLPWSIVRPFAWAERALPSPLLRLLGLRALFVIERTAA